MKNFEWCAYTLRHRRAFAYTVEKLVRDPALREEMRRRARVHDMDKMILYQFLGQRESQLLHVKRAPHHLENDGPRTYEDLAETVIDYECAPYTKPDKPLNAYDFVRLVQEKGYLDAGLYEMLLDIMHSFGIDRSEDLRQDTEAMAMLAALEPVTEEDILLEILEYVRDCPDEAGEVIGYVRKHAKTPPCSGSGLPAETSFPEGKQQ